MRDCLILSCFPNADLGTDPFAPPPHPQPPAAGPTLLPPPPPSRPRARSAVFSYPGGIQHHKYMSPTHARAPTPDGAYTSIVSFVRFPSLRAFAVEWTGWTCTPGRCPSGPCRHRRSSTARSSEYAEGGPALLPPCPLCIFVRCCSRLWWPAWVVCSERGVCSSCPRGLAVLGAPRNLCAYQNVFLFCFRLSFFDLFFSGGLDRSAWCLRVRVGHSCLPRDFASRGGAGRQFAPIYCLWRGNPPAGRHSQHGETKNKTRCHHGKG